MQKQLYLKKTTNEITLEEFNLKSDKVIYNEDTLATLERKIDRFMSNIFI